MGASLVWGAAAVWVVVGQGLGPAGLPIDKHADADVGAALFMVPSRSEGLHWGEGGVVEVRLERGGVGAGGQRQAVPWEAIETSWFYVRGGGWQENRDSAAEFAMGEREGAGMVVGVPVGGVEVVMAGFEVAPRVEVMDAGVWRALAEAELDEAVALAVTSGVGEGGVVRVRRVDSAKMVVRLGREPGSGGAVIDQQTATSKAGQAAEIRMLMDGTRVAPGLDLAVRGYANYASRGGVRVRAACDGCGEVQALTGDRHGIGAVRLSEAGRWRIVGRWAERLGAGEGADVALYTATLVFEAAAAEEGKR